MTRRPSPRVEPAHPETRGHLEALETAAFAARWHPYGGAPPEEVMVQFGLTSELYELRLGHALDFWRNDQLNLPQELHQSMREHCWNSIAAREGRKVRPCQVRPGRRQSASLQTRHTGGRSPTTDTNPATLKRQPATRRQVQEIAEG